MSAYLLDTNVFIWWTGDAGKLSKPVYQALQDPNNLLFISVASLWEMQIKIQIQKLTLPASLADILQKQKEDNGLQVLALLESHVFAASGFPMHHKDPFDRMIMAQAYLEDLIILSSDEILKQYPVEVLW